MAHAGDDSDAIGFVPINPREIPWRSSPSAPRVFLKRLGTAAECTMQLMRYDAGACLPIAASEGLLFVYVLEGELIHGERRLWPGTAAVIASNTRGEESRSDIGCTLLCVRRGLANTIAGDTPEGTAR